MNPARRVLGATGFRCTALVTLVAFATACHTWDVVPLKEIQAGQPVELTNRIRVTPAGGGPPVELTVQKVDYPSGVGIPEEEADKENPATVTLDLRNAAQVEIYTLSGWRTALLVTGVVLAAAAVVVLIIALTKTSCPFVYVDGGEGLAFVGEAYPGATSRATQREDLLPLPSLGRAPRLVLSNEARESQFTDLLEVVVVDRAPGRRALATHEAGIVIARPAVPPTAAADLEGHDVLPLVRDADRRAWLTDMDAMARRTDAPSSEGLVLTFAAPPASGSVALELDVGNTPWLDLVFGRFFALFGDDLEAYLDETDQPAERAPSLAWREREGVDLRVEVERAGRWERVAVVPTAGPASLRRLAVPLGPAAGPRLRVRLTGGLGFWQVDRVALAPLEPGHPAMIRAAPSRAVARDGTDVRGLLAAADGEYQVLADRGERVELRFDLPPVPPGLERDGFLRTSGYYRVHRPPAAERSVGTLLRLRDEPGSLSRFSLDLYRGYLGISGPVAAAR